MGPRFALQDEKPCTTTRHFCAACSEVVRMAVAPGGFHGDETLLHLNNRS